MAKQRPQPKPKAQQSSGRAAQASERATAAGPVPTRGAQGTPRRSTYFEAVAAYEKGVDALQRHDYRKALEIFEGILTSFPEERELHERVRLYLNICRRHATPPEDAPQSVDERLYASTLALNGGRYDEAIAHLRLVRDEDPDNDHALYMLAVAHAQRGEHAEAVAHLERAIALNSENRALARRDPDLESLQGDEAFQSAVDGGARASAARSRPTR
jgi:tetratricopeptide (TPR) repeat protein